MSGVQIPQPVPHILISLEGEMTQNKVIFSDLIKINTSTQPLRTVRIVSSDTSKFSTVSVAYEVYTGRDALDNATWRKADSEEERFIIAYLGMCYIKQLQDQTFGVKNV